MLTLTSEIHTLIFCFEKNRLEQHINRLFDDVIYNEASFICIDKFVNIRDLVLKSEAKALQNNLDNTTCLQVVIYLSSLGQVSKALKEADSNN